MESDLLSQLQSLAHYQNALKPEEFIERAREILFNAVSKILNLEKTISEKKTLLSDLEKEKEDLIKRLNESKNEREQLYDRLVEFDLTRNVELLELKKEIENIKSNNIQTIKERNRFESKYNELNLSYATIERENKRLKESADKLNSDLSGKKEETRRLENDLSSLAEELRTRTDEKISLETELAALNSKSAEKEREIECRLKEAAEETKSLLATVEDLKKNASSQKEEKDTFESKVRELEEKTALFEVQIENAARAGDRNKELSERLERTTEELKAIGKERDRLDQAVKDAEATISSLKSDVDGLNAVKESLSEKLMEAEKETSDLRKRASEDVEYLKKELSGLNEKLSSQIRENSSLKKNLEHLTSLVENKSLEAKQYAAEKNIIDSRLNELKEQLAQTKSEKAVLETETLKLEGEIAGHKTELETLRAQLSVIADHRKEQEDSPSFYLPSVNTPKEDIYLQKKSVRRGIKWVITLILIVSSLFSGWTVYKFKLESKQKIALNMPKVSQVQKDPFESRKPWPEEPRTLKQGNFTITATSLNPQLIKNWEIPLALTETERKDYYLIEIRADEGCIPDEFVKAPSMSFIDEEGKPLKIEDSGLKQNAIYKVNACNGENGVVFLRHFASLGKDQNPKGIIIKILKGEAPMIIK